jgi:lysyl-tRNA synthetase class 2
MEYRSRNWRLASRKKALQTRAAVIQAVRGFFLQRDYLEVETPQRIPAPAPESHIDAIPADGWFLHTSPELCMKRLLAAGYPRIFQVCHCWREGERGSRHIPEFTMLEWYRAGTDYDGLMEETEALIQSVARGLHHRGRLAYGGRKISLASPWPRIAVAEAFARYAHTSMAAALEQDLFDEIMVRDIEPQLGLDQPAFLYDYPAVRGSLARLRADDPSVAERCELYIAGVELANGFSELNDADEQRARFLQEEAYRRALGKRPYPLAEKFLDELHDMPAAAGIALGVDRLVMLFAGTTTIDDVVAFPPEEL